jgi:signal transduction histidine kinase
MRIEPLRQALDPSATVPDRPQPDPEVVTFDLNLIQTALQSSLSEIRNMAAGLRLPELGDLDLAETIRKAVDDYTRKTGRLVTVTGPDALPGNDALKSAAYRIAQEALNNSHLHANPTEQQVAFSADDEAITLTVGDDGNGFEPDKLPAGKLRRQLGLSGLRERAEILGGQLTITSAIGKGTTVTAVLPLQPEGSDTDK